MRHHLMELQNHWGEPSTKWTMFVHFAFAGKIKEDEFKTRKVDLRISI